MTDVELLGIVSFCVLMETHEGIIDTAPCYIREKRKCIADPLTMFSVLDDEKQAKVLAYGKRWDIDFEKLIKAMREDYYEIPATEYAEKYCLKEVS